MPTLTIQERGQGGGEKRSWVHECAEEVITIGRLEGSVVQLGSRGVSRQHAKIIADDDRYFVVDLGSGNGTSLNGVLLKPDEKNLLKGGDRITIDSFDIQFSMESPAWREAFEEEVTENDILEVKLLKKVLGALDKETMPSVEVLNGSAEGRKMFLTDEMTEMTLGRDPECEFPINEYVMSRRHAKVIKRWGGIAIRDLESKNGTFLNNRRIVEEMLHDGDRIALGTIVFIFRNPQEINLASLEEVSPRYRPAPVVPQEIPGVEEAQAAPASGESAGVPKQADLEEESSAVEQWEKLEKSLHGKENYPVPHAREEAIKRLTPMEIGMIGLGASVLIFALITLVNLLKS